MQLLQRCRGRSRCRSTIGHAVPALPRGQRHRWRDPLAAVHLSAPEKGERSPEDAPAGDEPWPGRRRQP
eukprot:scaffold124868_cov64-Phaeocystis_antarctica.AAC.2